MSKKVMTVTLRHDNREVRRMELDEKGGDVLIGRSSSCALCIPTTDSASSHRHARIFFQRGSFWLEDADSCNGVAKDGKKLTKPVKLKDKDVFSIGHCVLLVSVGRASSAKNVLGHDKLRFLNTEREGKDVEICPNADSTGGTFTIGSDPTNDLVLKNSAVSRRHAAIKLNRGGGCFIQDLGSRNGTFINDESEKLTKERFLQHRDKVRIAGYQFEYLKYGEPVPSPIRWTWRKTVMLLMLLMVGSVGYLFWIGSQAKPVAYREAARKLAKQEKFVEALEVLDQACQTHTGGTERELRQTDSLKFQIVAWQQTFLTWREVRDSLAKGFCGEKVLRKLVALHPEASSSQVAWDWNDTTAPKLRAEANDALELLKLRFDNAALKEQNPVDRAKLRKTIAELERLKKGKMPVWEATPYLKDAVDILNKQATELSAIEAAFGQVAAALTNVMGTKTGEPDFAKAIATFDELMKSESCALNPGIKITAEELKAICREFLATAEHLKRATAQLTSCDFTAMMKATLPLPSPDRCARHPAFSSARDWFVAKHETLLAFARMLAPMVRNLSEAGVTETDGGSLLARVCDGKAWDAALSFDCFKGAFPLASREFPHGVYDELFGIKTMYEGLRKLPATPDRLNRVERNFIPKAIVTAMLFNQVKTFKAALERDGAKSYRSGKLGELYAQSCRVMEMRDELVAMLRARQSKGGGVNAALDRRQIVAGYAAEYFTDVGEESYANLRALENAFRTLEKKVMALDEQRQRESDPEKRIKLRDQILAIGLPGNEVVREAWIDRVNGGGE